MGFLFLFVFFSNDALDFDISIFFGVLILGFRDDKAEEQLGSGSLARKKVTFDTNVKTYEHVLIDESTIHFRSSDFRASK